MPDRMRGRRSLILSGGGRQSMACRSLRSSLLSCPSRLFPVGKHTVVVAVMMTHGVTRIWPFGSWRPSLASLHLSLGPSRITLTSLRRFGGRRKRGCGKTSGFSCTSAAPSGSGRRWVGDWTARQEGWPAERGTLRPQSYSPSITSPLFQRSIR